MVATKLLAHVHAWAHAVHPSYDEVVEHGDCRVTRVWSFVCLFVCVCLFVLLVNICLCVAVFWIVGTAFIDHGLIDVLNKVTMPGSGPILGQNIATTRCF